MCIKFQRGIGCLCISSYSYLCRAALTKTLDVLRQWDSYQVSVVDLAGIRGLPTTVMPWAVAQSAQRKIRIFISDLQKVNYVFSNAYRTQDDRMIVYQKGFYFLFLLDPQLLGFLQKLMVIQNDGSTITVIWFGFGIVRNSTALCHAAKAINIYKCSLYTYDYLI